MDDPFCIHDDLKYKVTFVTLWTHGYSFLLDLY